MEATIVVAILALAMGVTIAGFSSGHAELRKVSGKLAGTVRAAYDTASLSGQTHRLVFSFEKPVVRVEATPELLAFDEEANPLVRGAGALGGGGSGMGLAGLLLGGMPQEMEESDEDEEEQEYVPPTALQALLGLNEEASGPAAASFQSTGNDLPLGDVKLLDVWVSGMSEPVTEGEVYLYFFPNGYTQEALVHLEGEDAKVFTVKIEALTGQTRVMNEYVEPPR